MEDSRKTISRCTKVKEKSKSKRPQGSTWLVQLFSWTAKEIDHIMGILWICKIIFVFSVQVWMNECWWYDGNAAADDGATATEDKAV